MQIHILVKGKVQGVSYRYYTLQKAKELEIKGTVRNLNDGNVEIFAEGSDEELQKLIKWCWRGSPLSRVSNVVINEVGKNRELPLFQILY